MKVLSKIKALFFSIYCILCLALVTIGMWIFKKDTKKMMRVRRIWAKSQRWFLGYKIKLLKEFDPNANMVIMNHQSMVDIMVLEEIYPKNLCWIAKKEIKQLPFIGHIIDIPKMIYIDRKNSRDLIRVLKETKDRIENNRVIAIFPEGTRRKEGKLLPFQPGAKAIADKLDLKVQPVVIIGAHDIINSHDFEVNSGEILIIPLPIIDRSNPNWLEIAKENMQKVMDEYNEN